jgi:hypothetical protein
MPVTSQQKAHVLLGAYFLPLSFDSTLLFFFFKEDKTVGSNFQTEVLLFLLFVRHHMWFVNLLPGCENGRPERQVFSHPCSGCALHEASWLSV